MKKKIFGAIEGAMRNNNIVIIIAVTVIIIGVFALMRMPRNEFPVFTIRQGVIVGVYPGASSEEIEKQLTSVVENYIYGYQEVKKAKTYSYSREGIMYIFVELNDNVKNADQFWSKLKHGLDELKMTLPSGVLALIANSDFGDTSALLITLSSDTKSYKELEEQLKKLENECRKIPATSKIKHFGLQKEKIFVNVKPELLNEYNIKSLTLLGSYQANGMVSFAGSLDDGTKVLPVHFPANFESEKDLAEQIVYSDPNGNIVRLKNIATIERRYDEPDSYIKQNGRKTILLSLEMQNGNNIVQYGKDVDQALTVFQKQCPSGIEVAKISELPKYVSDSVNNFMHEFLIAIVAVILVTMVLLPFRVASVAGITVPISVMITLAILYFLGVELHTVSLASLILVLGMIVDNSIVVIDNHVEKIDHGISPWHAAIKSAKELVAPIIVATLAIMASYIPLGFMVPGTAGEFMQTIPIVVSVALIVSILVALFLVPYLNFVFIKKGLKSKQKENKKSFLDRLQGWFDSSLEKAFNHPKMVIGAGIGTIVIAILIFKHTPQQLFPEMERNQFAVEVYLPTGSSLKSTQKVVDSLESLLMNDKRVTNVTSFIGTSSPRFHTVYAPNMPASNFGQLLINTISDKATREIVNEYEPKYSDNFVNAHVKWKILAMQASKSSIEIRISSDSVKDIRNVENQINQILARTNGLGWVRTDWDQPQQCIDVNLDRDKANRMGYYKSVVATSMMIGLDGIPLTTIWEDDYPVDVVLTQESSSQKNINTIKDQYITSPMSFSALPLRSMATFTSEWTEGTIVRRNGIPTLTFLVDNAPNAVASAILSELQPQIANLQLPEGTTVNYGGDYEMQQEVFVPMGVALGVSIIFIFFILLIQFKKEKIALLIMSSMLMTLPGAAIGLLLMHYAFSITAFIGITSLCGMVVRNGIILIDYARELHENERLSVREAALAAGKRRMRPIFLTSAGAGVGVVPMIISRSPLWGPLGTVICFGLLFSMVLALYILPILYSLAYSDRQKKPRFWSLPRSLKMLLVGILIASPAFVHQTQAQTISLDSCKQLALENNRKIKEAEMGVQAAEEQKKEAFTNYFPKVSATAVALRSTDYMMSGSIDQTAMPIYDLSTGTPVASPYYLIFPETNINAMDYMNTAAIMAAQPIYTGGRIYNGNKLAKLGQEVSEYQKQMTIDEVLIKTEELYWTIQTLKEKEKTVKSYQTMLDTLYRDVNNFVASGLTQKNDLLKVQIKQNELKTNLFKLQNGIELTQRALCQQIGISYDPSIHFVEESGITVSQFDTGDAGLLVQNRTEYQLLNKALEAQQLQKKMTMGYYLPQVTLVGTAFTFDTKAEITMAGQSSTQDFSMNNALAMLNVSIPISDWWGGSHKIQKQKIEMDKAKNALEENTELMTLQIRQAANEVQETQYQINVSQQSVEQAAENLKVTEDNFKAGAIAVSDLLEAQAMLQQALDNLTDAKCQYQIKVSNYKRATGIYR